MAVPIAIFPEDDSPVRLLSSDGLSVVVGSVVAEPGELVGVLVVLDVADVVDNVDFISVDVSFCSSSLSLSSPFSASIMKCKLLASASVLPSSKMLRKKRLDTARFFEVATIHLKLLRSRTLSIKPSLSISHGIFIMKTGRRRRVVAYW